MAIADFFNNITSAVGQFWNNISGTTAQNEFSAQEAQKQRDFEERMSNTAYQRGVTDMTKAGINPIYGTASGASTPTGSSAVASLGAGSGTVTGILDSASRLLNANDNTKNRRVQQSVYNSAGKLIKMVVTKHM